MASTCKRKAALDEEGDKVVVDSTRLEAATRQANFRAQRLHTTLVWITRLSLPFGGRLADGYSHKASTGEGAPSRAQLADILSEYYEVLLEDMARPVDERLLDLGVQYDWNGRLTLVMLDLVLLSMYENACVKRSKEADQDMIVRPEAIEDFYAREAPLEQTDIAGNTLLIICCDEYVEFARPSSNSMIRSWLERTSTLAHRNRSQKEVLQVAWESSDAEVEDEELAPKSTIGILLESGRFDLNACASWLPGSPTLICALVERNPPAHSLISRLLASPRVCVDFYVRDSVRGQTIDEYAAARAAETVAAEPATPTLAITHLAIAEHLAQHKQHILPIDMSLLEETLALHTLLPTILCQLARQYVDGSGRAFC